MPKSRTKKAHETERGNEPISTGGIVAKNAHEIDLTETERESWKKLAAFVSANDEPKVVGTKGKERRVLPIDEAVRARGIRFALGYALGEKPSRLLHEIGMSWGEVSLCRLASEEFRRIMDFFYGERRRLLAEKAEERLEMMIDGEINEREANAKSVMFALERLNGCYADERGKRVDTDGNGGGKGGGIVYQINIQCATGATAPMPADVIDIK